MGGHGSGFGADPARVWWDNAVKLWEIGVRAPQVMALRSMQLATSGPFLDAAARREAWVMGPEKLAAVVEASLAVMHESAHWQQTFAAHAMSSWLQMWLALPGGGAGRRNAVRATRRVEARGAVRSAAGAARISAAAIAPFHRRVTSNARRLGRRAKTR